MGKESLSSDTVLHLARLARLRVDAAEVPRLAADLERILSYVEVLDSVDTTGIEPTAHVQIERLPLRDDEPRPGLSREDALGQAPKRAAEGFTVPGFVEE
jgi:aspartyl-tRNA(Asn)/glutamyl-tRNA(Gln) amidotransferase subunit C